MSGPEVATTIRLARTKKNGWVTHPDEDRWYSSSEWRDRDKGRIRAFIRGVGQVTCVLQEEREVPALQRGYTLDELNEFVVRYGCVAAESCLWRVYPGAAICHGSEISIAQSLHRPCKADLAKFDGLFGRRWRQFLMGMAVAFGMPVFDIAAFDGFCQEVHGYVEDGKTSLGDFMRAKWGDEVHDWFVDRILNSDVGEARAET